MTCRTMPARSAGSPAPRRWSAGENQFQHLWAVRARRLRRVEHEEAFLLCERVHARAGREVVGVLRAAVQHHHQRQHPPSKPAGAKTLKARVPAAPVKLLSTKRPAAGRVGATATAASAASAPALRLRAWRFRCGAAPELRGRGRRAHRRRRRRTTRRCAQGRPSWRTRAGVRERALDRRGGLGEFAVPGESAGIEHLAQEGMLHGKGSERTLLQCNIARLTACGRSRSAVTFRRRGHASAVATPVDANGPVVPMGGSLRRALRSRLSCAKEAT